MPEYLTPKGDQIKEIFPPSVLHCKVKSEIFTYPIIVCMNLRMKYIP